MKLKYFDLSHKVAVVSGGATGIGYSIAQGLGEAGATVVVCSRRLEVCQQSADALHQESGAKIIASRCDITQPASIHSLVHEVKTELGGVDILVNCAGIGGSEKPVLNMEDPDWDHVLDVNLKGAFNFSRAVAGPMIERGQGGRIINVASIAGLFAWPNMASYCAAKGGLVQLTKVMALEWMRHKILVNAILPGYFETPMNTEFFASEPGQKVIKRHIPMRRLGQTDELKGLAILLASSASSFMSGSAVVVDGGQTLS